MYEKFTPQVEQIIQRARALAHQDDQEYLGTEHVLLAILQADEFPGARLLLDHGVDEHRLKAEISRLVKKEMEDTWVLGQLPGSPHLKNAVASAIEQARLLKSDRVRAEHLLLGLLKEKGCIAERVLGNLGVSYETARAELLRAVSKD